MRHLSIGLGLLLTRGGLCVSRGTHDDCCCTTSSSGSHGTTGYGGRRSAVSSTYQRHAILRS